MIFQKVFPCFGEENSAPIKRLSSQLFQQVALFQGQPDGRAQGTDTITAMTAFTPEVTAFVATERSTGPKALPSSYPR